MAYSDVVIADGAVSYWRLNGGTAPDSVDSKPATLHGSVTTGVTGAIVGDSDQAMSFDGSTAYLNGSSLAITGTLTIECWVKSSAYPGATAVAYSLDTTGNYLAAFNGGPRFSLRIAGTQQVNFESVTLTTGVWHHIAGTWDGSTMVTYTDGVANTTNGSLSGAVTNSASSFYIGSFDGASSFFSGSIDEVAVYTTALSAAKILNHYTVGITPEPPRVLGGATQSVKRASYY